MTMENQPDLKNPSFINLFTHSPIGIFVVQDGKFQHVNPEFQKISGYDEDELLGKESALIILDEDFPLVKEKAINMLKGKRSSPYLYRAVDKNGELKWIIESVTSVNYGGKRAALGYFMDNTEHERAKDAIRISEDKFHKAFQLCPEWFVIVGLKDDVYQDVNEAFLKTTGYRREEVIGRTPVELCIWEDLNQRSAMVAELQEKGMVRNLEARFRMKSGEIRFMLWSAEIIDYGAEKCLLAVARDITHRKLAEQEQLQRIKLQGVLEMAGAACHELTQPLQSVFCLMDELSEKSSENDILTDLKRQLSRMKDITRKVNSITSYQTKDYIQGLKIIDIEKASGSE
ncbi:MAG: PAS domain-containing protein [Pseudomonadota bacterium]